ncbi:cell wall protein [Apiospora phragmitis]|uniref:Cell wall protein n=1 Tax=Apiospora phragmitis TaxID=2905665 RepID=A0ABR1T7D3_9PEZI
MKLASLFLKATLAGLAYAQLEALQQAIGAVSDALGDLDTKVKAISGTDANTAAPVLQASQKILMTMQSSTAKVSGAEALGVFDALSLQDTASSLVTSVNTTMKNLAAKKPQLDMLGVTSVAVKSIQDQKTASKALGDAIVSKVPAVGQGIAQGSIDQINAALEGGIKALSAGGAGAGAGTGAGGATGGGAAAGGSMSGGSGRNSSSSSGAAAGSGQNSTSANGTGSNSRHSIRLSPLTQLIGRQRIQNNFRA